MSDTDDLGVVLDAAQAWLAAGHGVAIATVIETWGSAPRAKGAHLVVRDDGLFEGSVSGGCVEGEVISEALALIPTGGWTPPRLWCRGHPRLGGRASLRGQDRGAGAGRGGGYLSAPRCWLH